MKPHVSALVLNWNEKKLTEKCVNSLLKQTLSPDIILVDNGSADDSYDYLANKFSGLKILKNSKNLGFAGGINTGLRHILDNKYDYVVLLNNDAWVETKWIEVLIKKLEKNPKCAVAAGKLLKIDKKTIDSTGDQYSSWGLPIARQRGLPAEKAVNQDEQTFGATAGACIYRTKALRDVGLFDERFFAYYEDTDLNFRLQLAGWKILYTPDVVGYHAIGGTSSKLNGFTTYQTMKNLPMLFWKVVPTSLLPRMFPRFFLAYFLIFFNSLLHRDRRWPAIKGKVMCVKNFPYAFKERRKIQKNRKVSDEYIWSILHKDLPPDAHRLRKFRSFFTGKR